MKTLWAITLFPEYFVPLVERGVVGRALRGEGFDLATVLLRGDGPTDFKGVDDAPYGGGQGMVIRPDVLQGALMEVCRRSGKSLAQLHVILPSPRGRVWGQDRAWEFSRNLLDPQAPEPVFICGRYEGIDERFIQSYVQEEISLGDYILSGGELAVMAIVDSTLRLCPGVLGHPDSPHQESFAEGLLEHPLYTRPGSFEGQCVPEVLTSGHQARIAQWKRQQSLEVTQKYRPDLLRGSHGGGEG